MSERTRLHQLAAGPLTLALIGLVALAGALLLASARPAAAQDGTNPVGTDGKAPLHPVFPLLDAQGVNVLESGAPVSTMQTCGACHDTQFIASHSFHSNVGLNAYGQADQGYLAWDSGPGLFGRWDPLAYRYLSPEGDERIDMTTAEWLEVMGPRQAGGGPAETSRLGTPLTELGADASPVEASIVDPATGELQPWDWSESGTEEMNCFLCHFAHPDNASRTAALQAGDFGWANSATLAGSGVIEQTGAGWQWNEAAFDAEGNLDDAYITIQDPTAENCGQCHGLVHVDNQTPLVVQGCDATQYSTITTGQIFSPQRLENTGLNLVDKDDLSRSFDIHAERVLECTDCHYSLNNPVYYQESDASKPDHLVFDPRRIDLGEYLYRPVHEFAKGKSVQSPLAPELDNTLRRCESCHDAEQSHDWLPYLARHTETLGCETCHIPRLYGPARQTNDWTVLHADSTPQTDCRGIAQQGPTFGETLLSGFEPVLLPRQDADGSVTLAPHNLITSWYWIYGDPARPVPLRDLEAAWLEDGSYPPDVLAAFDANGDGTLDDTELRVDTAAKVDLIAGRLTARGLDNPRISGEVRPYTISHDVAAGDWAIKDCDVCHSEQSRLAAPTLLADYIPNGVMPQFVGDAPAAASGDLTVDETGALVFTPKLEAEGLDLYVFGHHSHNYVDLFGAFLFLGTAFGVSAHSGLRYVSARRRVPRDASSEVRREYMYSVYERQWHWLQTAVILGLIFTGLVIHRPDSFGIFSFRYVVEVHNVLAAILVINAALAAFYHLASGEIRQFLPEPHGFFGQSFAQALFYVRGIFRGDPHPFAKTPERKMNPLQQMTYLVLLNVLLPLQILTGMLMWGAQTWPQAADALGGLSFLAPLHTLVAWSLAAFIVAHVYLTTTERTPLTGIKSMVTGWSELDDHEHEETK